MTVLRQGIAVSGLALLVVVGLTGCASSSSGSRHTLYDSVESIAADSSDIVIGTVQTQGVDGDATVSTVEVEVASTNPQLGANLAGGHGSIEVGDVIEVRQQGDPLLASGDQYLLFVTPTELSGDAADQYYVTGAVAGIYERDGDGDRRAVIDSGDTLPETISIAE